MPSISIRWKQVDLDENLPERYETALKLVGFTPSGATRAMIRRFTEEVEKHGGSLLIKAGALEPIKLAKGKRK